MKSCCSRWRWEDVGRVRSSWVGGRGRRSDVLISLTQGANRRMCLGGLGSKRLAVGVGDAGAGRRGRSGGVSGGRPVRNRIRIWLGTFVCVRGRCGVGRGGFLWRGCRIASLGRVGRWWGRRRGLRSGSSDYRGKLAML